MHARQSLRVHGYMRDSSVIHSGAHGAAPALNQVLLGRAAVSDDDAGALLLHNRKGAETPSLSFGSSKRISFQNEGAT